jgi:DNA (cytosine-5)-methyltransferase 1
LSGNSKESKKKRETTSSNAEGCTGSSGFRMTAFGQYADDDTASTLKQRDYKDATDLVAHAFKVRGGSEVETGEQGGTPGKKAGKGYLGQDEKVFTIGTTQDQQIAVSMAIRRLTPKECERLQGFPDDWTLIPYRNKSAEQCPDGPRYKACGNPMAVPVMRWIGQRIQMVEQLMKEVNG